MTVTPGIGTELSVPMVANKYVPLFELGRGGMGNVVLAVVQGPGGFNKLQVVKYLRPELAENPEFLTMFLDEARLSARINHVNVVQTNEVGFDGENYFLAMEYLEGQSLEAVLTRAANLGPLEVHVFARVIVEACAGLHHAHELADFDGRPLNVVHRDVSPHNIFITYDGTTKLLDFGIAKAADTSSQTRTGIIKGKVAYMAPEQFKSGNVDRRADIFALGAILWRVVAGKRLWKNLTDVEVYQHLAAGNIPSPLELNPEAPQALVGICMKALAPDASDRYQTAAELQQALEDFLDHYPRKASPRSIGRQVSEMFADRRAKVKAAIETRLAGGIPEPLSSGIPQLAPSGSKEIEVVHELSPDRRSYSLRPPPAEVNFQSTYPTTPSVVQPGRNRPTALTLGAVALSIVSAGVIVATLLADRFRGEAAPVASASGASRPEITQTTLSIETDPADAKVKLDDRRIEHRTVLKSDRALHKVTVEADGYVPHVQMVEIASSSVDLHIALERVRATGSGTSPADSKRAGVSATRPHQTVVTAPPPSAKLAPAPPPPSSPTPSAENKGNGLDKEDPWARNKRQ